MTCSNCQDCAFDASKDVSVNYHEIHLTIQSDDVKRDVDICKTLGIKTILVEGAGLHDFMTSIKYTGDNDAALNVAKNTASLLKQHNMPVTRMKLETAPDNPVWKEGNGYFESHLAVKLAKEDLSRLRTWATSIGGLHLSKNAFKADGDIVTMMLTYRRYDAELEEFRRAVAYRKSILECNGFVVDRVIIEYCWYDDNVKHDKDWIKT